VSNKARELLPSAGPVEVLLKEPSQVSRQISHRPSYVPELDGLRTLAILGVLLFHLEVPGFALGWTGVPLFFVLSGFLITRILLSSKEGPNYFSRFYIRRSLRIFPIYYIVMLLSFAVFYSVDKEQIKYLKYYATYLQTWPILHTQFKSVWVLGHTWTLAIEEQFYLVWPLIIFFSSRMTISLLSMALIIAAPLIRILVLDDSNVYLSFSWLPAETDTLSAGSLLATMLDGGRERNLSSHLKVILCVLVGSFVWISALVWLSNGQSAFWEPANWARQPQNVVFISALAIFFAAFVAAALVSPVWLRWLRHPAMVYVGRRSYGIYLYHPFVFWFTDLPYAHRIVSSRYFSWLGQVQSPIIIWSLKLLITFAIACLSWKWVESPILELKEKAERKWHKVRSGGNYSREH
jgi:peptidoglycan/LPS O-acetylase OafA/YrhL